MARRWMTFAMTSLEPVLRQDGVALWRQIARPPAARYRRRHLSARRPPANRSGTVAAVPRQPPHGAARAGGTCRAAAWSAWSRAAARSSPRTCWNTRSRRARDSPNGSAGTTWNRPGACCSSRRPPPIRISRRPWHPLGQPRRAAGAAGFADDRPVSLSQHYFPTARLRGMLDALRASPTHHRGAEGGRRDGLPASGDPRHRAPAERGGSGTAAHAAQPAVAGHRECQRRSRPARWWNSASRAIQRRACRSSSNPESETQWTDCGSLAGGSCCARMASRQWT